MMGINKNTIQRRLCFESIRDFLILLEPHASTNICQVTYRYGQAIGCIRMLYFADGCSIEQRNRIMDNLIYYMEKYTRGYA